MVISMILFIVRGRKVYDGPVVTVEEYEMARRMEGIVPKHI
jgi:hypothetical protein